MEKRIIVYILVFGFLITVILSIIRETQNNEYAYGEIRQVKGQLKEDEAIHLFKYLPVGDW